MPRFFSLCIFVSDGFRLESLKGDRSVGVLIWLRATVEDVVFRCGLSARFQIDLRARARWVFVGGYSGQDIWWGSNDAPAGLHDLRVSFSDRRTEASRDTRGQFCKKSTFLVYAVDSAKSDGFRLESLKGSLKGDRSVGHLIWLRAPVQWAFGLNGCMSGVA